MRFGSQQKVGLGGGKLLPERSALVPAYPATRAVSTCENPLEDHTATNARPHRRPGLHPAAVPVEHPTGSAIGPAVPSAGGEDASEAEDGEVEAAWNRKDFTPISRRALKAT